jgi:hypothetical protein
MNAIITLQFCSFTAGWGRLINWGTQGNVGHVDIVLDDGSLLGAQHEAGLGGKSAGVQVRPHDYGRTCGMVGRKLVTLPVSEACADEAYAWALSQEGSRYDTEAIEGIAVGKNWSTEGKFICSGLATGMLTQPDPAFFAHKLARPWRIVTPEQLLILCSAFAGVVDVAG